MVVDPVAERLLVIHHAKIGRWLQPGGHADGEGNLALVALTEASEETGLTGLSIVTPAVDIDVHAIGARPGEPAHHHLDVRFVVLVGPDPQVAPNHETLGARWVTATDPVIAGSVELTRLAARGLEVARHLAAPSGA
jgi:8-oxo-dGTP pyrophosphatase MutT (NUDIX family)